jgi:hypothetical protein
MMPQEILDQLYGFRRSDQSPQYASVDGQVFPKTILLQEIILTFVANPFLQVGI